SYVRRKVSLQVQPGDRMPAYLLIPKNLKGREPAVVCFYGTTAGAGKDTTVGLSGAKPGSPPERNRAFAIDMVEAGFVAFAADYLRHGLPWGVPKGGGNSQSMPALRPYVLDHTRPLPVTFSEFTALIAPRPLAVGQAVGERRPMEEENHAAVAQVYRALGAGD